jgi:hypothetical protein
MEALAREVGGSAYILMKNAFWCHAAVELLADIPGDFN